MYCLSSVLYVHYTQSYDVMQFLEIFLTFSCDENMMKTYN